MLEKKRSKMLKEINQIKVFVSGPSDVEEEKQIVREVCDSITRTLESQNIHVTAVDWRKDIFPEITGERTQALINDQIGEYDIYIGILWKRFGDRQETGLTPTQEEFEEALRRRKNTGKPVIRFFFKRKEYYSNGSYEAQQATEVQKFKEEIKNRDIGPYGEFEEVQDFQRKIFESILDIIQNYDFLTAREFSIPKEEYREVQDYLSRKVHPASDYIALNLPFLHIEPHFPFLRKELSQDVTDLVKKNNRIVILGDAGVGKTTELKRIAHHFSSKSGSPFYPFMVTLNTYVNESIDDLLPSNWTKIPDNQLLIILDGLDEIESKNKNDAIRRIESFSDNHPDSHIIVSSRTNFYNPEGEESVGTLRGFSSYILLELDNADVQGYIEEKLGTCAENFNEIIYENRLQDLLKIPFYLVRLVDLYRKNNTLPKSKAEIYEQLLKARIQLDREHFRTTVNLQKTSMIIETLERVALGMETLGRNYITDDEFRKLVPEESLRELLSYCTTWTNNGIDIPIWHFEHNNFQEYLAARILSRLPFETVHDFVSFPPAHRKIIPSWANTLSFLFSIVDKNHPLYNDLFKWIKEIESELIVKFEPDKVEESIRFQIFKNVFDYYKERSIWINPEKFDYDELSRFGQSEETIKFLLTEIENAAHHTVLGNAISLLGNLMIPHSYKQRATDLLVGCVLNSESGDQVQKDALIALANLKLNTQQVVNQIVSALRACDSSWVRYGLYYFVCKGDQLDENIDVFLEGMKYVRFKPNVGINEARLGDEWWHLKLGLEEAKSPEAIRKILIYFKENPNDLGESFLDKSISIIVENAAAAYVNDSSLLDIVRDLFVTLLDEYLDKTAGEFISFFDKTGTRFELFQDFFSQLNSSKRDTLRILALLADERAIEFFVQQYTDHDITEDDVWAFQNCLSWRNKDLFLPFNKLINEKSGNKFVLPPREDFDEKRKKRIQKDIGLLFDKQESFLHEIKRIFDTEKKEALTGKELLRIESKLENQYRSDLVLSTLYRIAGNESITFERAAEVVDGWDWDEFRIRQIYNYMTREEVALSKEQQDWIGKWCTSRVRDVDFKSVLMEELNKQYNTDWKAICLWYFLRKLNLTYPEAILLDMLSFDWLEENKWVGIGYLEEVLREDDITERILENLRDGIKNNIVLGNHIDYCRRHNVKEVLPFAFSEIANTDRESQARQIALETIYEVSETTSDLEKKLPGIRDPFKWIVIEKLLKNRSEYMHEFLLNILKNGNEKDQLRAADYLIQMEDLDGLRYYVEWVEEHRRLPYAVFGKSSINNLRKIESTPLLIRLLKASYQNRLYEDLLEMIHSIVLDTLMEIALQSEENYLKVRASIEVFIKENTSIIKNVEFLDYFLDSLDMRHYLSKGRIINIDDVIKSLENLEGVDC